MLPQLVPLSVRIPSLERVHAVPPVQTDLISYLTAMVMRKETHGNHSPARCAHVFPAGKCAPAHSVQSHVKTPSQGKELAVQPVPKDLSQNVIITLSAIHGAQMEMDVQIVRAKLSANCAFHTNVPKQVVSLRKSWKENVACSV